MTLQASAHLNMDGVGYVGRISDEIAEEGSVRDLERDDDSYKTEEEDTSSEDEKQMEDDTPCHNKLQSLVKAIKRKEIDWDKPKENFGKEGHFASHLTERSERSGDCILHFLVKDEDPTVDENKELAKAIKYTARFHPKLMTMRNGKLLTPLYCALDNLTKKRVYLIKNGFMKSRIKPDHMAKAIARACGEHEENCLHRALKTQSPDYALLNLLIDNANQQAINARDNLDRTPLHRAVQYEHSSEERLNVIDRLITLGEPDSSGESRNLDSMPVDCAFDTYASSGRDKLSAYEYHMKTREQNEQREQRGQREQREQPQAAENSGPGLPQTTKEEPKRRDEADKRRLPAENASQNQHMHWQKMGQQQKAIPNPARPAVGGKGPAGQDDVPKPGITRANTIAKRVTLADNAVDSKPSEKRDHRAEKAQERERWSQKIRSKLKLHCLRTRTIAQATRFLYGTNKDDIQLYFDYSGLPKEDADPGTFYDNFRMTQFDEVLQYVEFPTVRLKEGKMPQGEQFRNHRALFHDKSIGRKDLLFFFSWLKDKGVKHIIKVIVQDATDSHCDEVIETCLSGVQIDILDWSKPDLDPEMLCTAVPDVKELHLRWGGNNAVLRAWGEAEGLRMLKDLRTIYLYQDQSTDYTRQKVDSFAKRITLPVSLPRPESANATKSDDQKTERVDGSAVSIPSVVSPRKIEVLIAHGISRDQLQAAGSTTSETIVSSKTAYTVHKWLESIDSFAAELKTLMEKIGKKYHQDDEVKVALIDDGVDLCEKAFRDRVIHGKSFGYYWDGEQRDQRAKQWYVSETGHGTVMAHMILRVCPMAKIYPIKLDITRDPTTRASKIKPESAAEAINAAVEQGVHIISMSWTVNDPPEGVRTKLDEALGNAAANGILMFCSSPDEGNYISGDPYPSAYGPDKFFRIGASQADGHPYSWVSLDKVDYLFPGVEVVQANKKDIKLRGVEDRKAETGSSISTALAAGLAALVVWFVIIGAKYSWDENQGGGDGLDANDVKDIQNIKKMKQAFQKLGASRESNEKFVEIWTVLDDRTKALKELHGDQNVKAARQVIHKLARNLIVKA